MAENKWVNEVITILIGVITPFITDRGPPCMGIQDRLVIWNEVSFNFDRDSII